MSRNETQTHTHWKILISTWRDRSKTCFNLRHFQGSWRFVLQMRKFKTSFILVQVSKYKPILGGGNCFRTTQGYFRSYKSTCSTTVDTQQ